MVNFKYPNYYNDEDVIYDEGRPDWVPKDAFLIDCHTHTRASDGLLTPKQLIFWHISNGYNGMVVTDHNTLDSVKPCQEIVDKDNLNFLIIPGVEFTSLRTHLNIIYSDAKHQVFEPKPNMLWTSKQTIKKAINKAHKQQAIVQFNHRDWYPHKQYLPMEWYLENDIDGWEIYNGFGFIDKKAPAFTEENKDVKIMFESAGTDVHDPAKHHRVYTEVITEDKSVKGTVEAMKQGKTKVYYNVEDEKARQPPERGKLKINPKRNDYIKRWNWIYIAGNALINGKHRKAFVILLLISLVVALTLSLIL
ncbi:MAG: hypothetical protein GF364_10775 [Candidatus Lokiarchaeota archaeon]|nr:hypothetical protein [Candidatus Lokiarchaeota archaeon]